MAAAGVVVQLAIDARANLESISRLKLESRHAIHAGPALVHSQRHQLGTCRTAKGKRFESKRGARLDAA